MTLKAQTPIGHAPESKIEWPGGAQDILGCPVSQLLEGLCCIVYKRDTVVDVSIEAMVASDGEKKKEAKRNCTSTQ